MTQEKKFPNSLKFVFVLAVFTLSCFAQVSSHAPAINAPAHGAMGPGPHGMKSSSRVQFAKACGISNPSMSRAITLTRNNSGSWSRVTKTAPAAPTDSALVRAWHEKAWVVEVQEADAAGDSMHIADMCFNQKGNVTRIVDKYINMPKCGCMRVTESAFNAAGKLVKSEQSFYKGDSPEKVAKPASASMFPAPFEHTKLEQLPFWGFLKGMQ